MDLFRRISNKYSGIRTFIRHPRRLFRLFWLGVGAAFIFNSLYMARMFFFSSRTSGLFLGATHIETVAGQLLGAFFCFRCLPSGWWRSHGPSEHQNTTLHYVQTRIPFWIGLVFVVNALGDATYAYYNIQHIKPFLDWPDAIYLLHYPCLLMAILALPRRLNLAAARLRVVLDGVLIITALITFSWYFLLGPMLLQSQTTLFIRLVGAAFPFGDVFLGYCLFQIVQRTSEPTLLLTQRLFWAGLASIIIANSLSEYQIVQSTHQLELWIAIFQCIGYLLIALTAQAVFYAGTRRNINLDAYIVHDASRVSAVLWKMLLPYSVIPAVGILMGVIWYMGRSGLLADGVFLGGVILIGQVVLRQVLITRETFFYTQELQSMQNKLHSNNLALAEANRRLEGDYERERHLNEMKDQFLLNVNHELRTPLTEIHGYLELLHEHYATLDATTKANFLSHALHGSEELHLLINTVLDTLRSDDAEKDLRWENLSVREIVQSVVNLFEPQKRYVYQLELVIPEMLMVRADRQYLHQILRNLLSNAFKYSPHQTVITIGAKHTTNAQICIWVQDSGPGIAPAEMAQLFGKFVRLKRDQASSVRGTGLGLYISKQLVEAMGGHIWVESSGVSGEGSRFCFMLPKTPETEQMISLAVNTASMP